MKRPTSPPPRSRRRSRQAEHLCRMLQRLWQDYREQHRRCQRRCRHDSVHDLRVATRRLLAHLDLLRVLINHEALDKSRRILTARLGFFAELRDTQVQLDHVTRQIRAFPELQPLRDALEKSERRAIEAAADALAQDRNHKLRQHFTVVTSRLAVAVAEPGAGRRQALAIREALQSRFQQVVQRQQRAAAATDGIHRVRVAMKKYRYLLEALQPILRRFSPSRFQRLVTFQDVTGELHDIEVLLARLGAMVKKEKLDAWRTHRFRELLTRRHAALMVAYHSLAGELFADGAPALRFTLQSP